MAKKRIKHWNRIIIPCLSVAAVASVAIPMSIMNTRHYVSIDFEHLEVELTSDTYTYTFFLKHELEDGQSIICTANKSKAFILDCWLEPTSSEPIQPKGKNLKVVMKFKSPSPEITKGQGAIDAHFTCIDANGKTVWKDSIKSLRFTKTK